MAQVAALRVDDEGSQARGGREQRELPQFVLDACAVRLEADVRAGIGQQHEHHIVQAAAARLLRDLQRRDQRGGERRTTTGRDLVDSAPQQLHAAGRRQQQFGALAAEAHQRDTVAVHIGLLEQRVHRALGLAHAVERHAAARIHREQEQRTRLVAEALDAQVFGAYGDTTRAARAQALPTRRRAQRGDDIESAFARCAGHARDMAAAGAVGAAARA